MANNPGAKKAIRKIAARTEVNKARRTRVRTFLRKFQEAVTGGDAGAAKTAFIEAQSELMRAVSKGVVHKNTGSRKVSRWPMASAWLVIWAISRAMSAPRPISPSRHANWPNTTVLKYRYSSASTWKSSAACRA